MEQSSSEPAEGGGEAVPAGRLAALVFRVGGVRFGLQARQVCEAIDRGSISPVPLAPANILGVMNHRGRIVTVLDGRRVLRRAGGEAGGGDDASDQLLLLAWQSNDVALEVGAIEGVSYFDRALTSPPTEDAPAFARQTIPDDRGAVTVIDIPALMEAVIQEIS